MRPEHLATPEALQSFLHGFETGTLDKPEWTHAAHVAATAATYLHSSSYEAVLPLIRWVPHVRIFGHGISRL